MIYLLYQVDVAGNPLCPTDAFGTSGKAVVKAAKTIPLLAFGLRLIFTYPFQVSRIQRLTKDRKIKKTLQTFYSLSPEERQKQLDKMERFMDT